MNKPDSKQKPTEQKAQASLNRISQSDIPAYSLEQALKIPLAIYENYGLNPVTPLELAKALEVSPTSSAFKMLCGASIAYGLTEGGYNAKEVKVTDLGKKIVMPLDEADEINGKITAFLRPRIIKEFLEMYDGKPLPPKDELAHNVLQTKGVPKDRAANIYSTIMSGSKNLGLLTTIKEKSYVSLKFNKTAENISKQLGSLEEEPNCETFAEEEERFLPEIVVKPRIDNITENKKVFITHGKNTKFIDSIKKVLSYIDMEPVVAIQTEATAKPLPDKIMDAMWECSSAIIHVDHDKVLIDKEDQKHAFLNENVLIEIGAAMALYKRKFILLVRDGVVLPSNLQGLYQVRYKGDELTSDEAFKLLDATKELKK